MAFCVRAANTMLSFRAKRETCFFKSAFSNLLFSNLLFSLHRNEADFSPDMAGFEMTGQNGGAFASQRKNAFISANNASGTSSGM